MKIVFFVLFAYFACFLLLHPLLLFSDTSETNTPWEYARFYDPFTNMSFYKVSQEDLGNLCSFTAIHFDSSHRIDTVDFSHTSAFHLQVFKWIKKELKPTHLQCSYFGSKRIPTQCLIVQDSLPTSYSIEFSTSLGNTIRKIIIWEGTEALWEGSFREENQQRVLQLTSSQEPIKWIIRYHASGWLESMRIMDAQTIIKEIQTYYIGNTLQKIEYKTLGNLDRDIIFDSMGRLMRDTLYVKGEINYQWNYRYNRDNQMLLVMYGHTGTERKTLYDFNQNGVRITATKKIADTLHERLHFDPSGRVIKEEHYNPHGSIIYTQMYSYFPSGNIREQKWASGDTQACRLERFNEQGQLIFSEKTNAAGELQYTLTSEGTQFTEKIYKEGTLREAHQFGYTEGGEKKTFEHRFYDGLGKLREITKKIPNRNIYRREIYYEDQIRYYILSHFTSQGHIFSDQYYTYPANELYLKQTYNLNQNLILSESIEQNCVIESWKYEYEQDKIQREEYYYLNTRLYAIEYDEQQNEIEIINYDRDLAIEREQLIRNELGELIQVKMLDDFHAVSQTYYNEANLPEKTEWIRNGEVYTISYYTFNQKNQLILEEQRRQGKPIEIITRMYDNRDRLTRKSIYNGQRVLLIEYRYHYGERTTPLYKDIYKYSRHTAREYYNPQGRVIKVEEFRDSIRNQVDEYIHVKTLFLEDYEKISHSQFYQNEQVIKEIKNHYNEYGTVEYADIIQEGKRCYREYMGYYGLENRVFFQNNVRHIQHTYEYGKYKILEEHFHPISGQITCTIRFQYNASGVRKIISSSSGNDCLVFPFGHYSMEVFTQFNSTHHPPQFEGPVFGTELNPLDITYRKYSESSGRLVGVEKIQKQIPLERYFTNQEGRIIRKEHLLDDYPIQSTDYEYGETNNLERTIERGYWGQALSHTTYQYNSQGDVLEKTTSTPSGSQLSRDVFYYNREGMPIRKITYGSNNQERQRIEWSYNRHKRLTEEVERIPTLTIPLKQTIYTYSNLQNLTSKKMYVLQEPHGIWEIYLHNQIRQRLFYEHGELLSTQNL